MRNKKASVTMFLVFIIAGIIIITISAFVAPMMVRFNTEMYRAGEDIYRDANVTANLIQNETVRASTLNIIQDGLSATEFNIEVNSKLFQYGWVLVLGLTALVIFLFTRSLVETRAGGGLI